MHISSLVQFFTEKSLPKELWPVCQPAAKKYSEASREFSHAQTCHFAVKLQTRKPLCVRICVDFDLNHFPHCWEDHLLPILFYLLGHLDILDRVRFRRNIWILYTDGSKTLHTLLIKHYINCLDGQSRGEGQGWASLLVSRGWANFQTLTNIFM